MDTVSTVRPAITPRPDTAAPSRHADHPVDPMFVDRWSPRAMSGEPVSKDDLNTLFEAARWAPSSGNTQPWKFVYAQAGTPNFTKLHDLLVEGNRDWCGKAGALIVVMSKTTTKSGKPAPTHSFDTGSAWMSMALQGQRMPGERHLVMHGLGGFDYDKTRQVLNVPADVAVECMIAVGHPGATEELPERLRARETPNGRLAVSEFAFEGGFPTAP